MTKLIRAFAYLVLFVFGLSIYGWMVKHQSKGSKDFGPSVNFVLRTLSEFPDLFSQAVEETQNLPHTFIKTPENFERINRLDEDIWALMTYTSEGNQRTVEVRNLRNDEIRQSWILENVNRQHHRVMHPLIMPNGNLVYSLNGLPTLRCINGDGEQMWHQKELEHHHSLNLDADNNIWSCTYDKQEGRYLKYDARFQLDWRKYDILDNCVTQFDGQTGEILFHESIAQILLDNGLEHMVMRSTKAEDPFHLNDVQPALSTTKYWNRGDVFMSFRNMSAVLQYRPNTGEVIRVITGPFYAQHDVDFVNDSTIALFNNNSHNMMQFNKSNWPKVDEQVDLGKFYSHILEYDLARQEFTYIEKATFDENQIFTYTEGLFESLPGGGYFIEEQNDAVIWVIRDGEVLYKNVLDSQHEGYHHLSNWTRIISTP